MNLDEIALSVRQKAAGCKDETAQLLSEIVKIPSLSGGEQTVVERIGNMLEERGFDEVRTDGLGNLIARIGRGDKKLAIDAHIDTVAPGNLDNWETDPFTPMVQNGRIIGRGTSDQEGGMAAMVYAAEIIKAMGLNERFTILFTGTVMEEDCDGLCWHYLIEEE